MQITEYYQAVGVVFGCWCLIQPIIDAFRPLPEQTTPPPTEVKTITTFTLDHQTGRIKKEEKEIPQII